MTGDLEMLVWAVETAEQELAMLIYDDAGALVGYMCQHCRRRWDVDSVPQHDEHCIFAVLDAQGRRVQWRAKEMTAR